MQTLTNAFKTALLANQTLFGLWIALADPYCAEVCADAGFDWLLIDGEHGPNDVRSILAQLQAIAASPSQPVVRPPIGDPVLIKQLLDVGVQNLLVPMIDTAEQAAALVRATRYPPEGMRGVGSALARASRWNRIPNYVDEANAQICLLVQVESVKGLQNLSAIAAIDGVDGVFIGPADLSASMGHRSNPAHPEVLDAIDAAIRTIVAAGKAPGIIAFDETLARKYVGMGCRFVAVGADATLLSRATSALAARYKHITTDSPPSGAQVY